MEFTEALKKVYGSSRKKEHLNDPFLLHSRISDLIGDSYNDKKKAKAFLAISRRVNLFALIGEYGENCRKQIIKKYGEVTDIVTEAAFGKIVDIVYETFYPTRKKPASPTVKKNASVQKAKVVKAQNTEEPEKRTPLGGKPKSSILGNIATLAVLIFIIIAIAAIPVAVGVAIYGVKYLCDNVPWDIGQWIIGAIGSLLIFIAMLFAGRLLYYELSLEYFEFVPLALYAVAILNFVAKLIFTDYMTAYFICVGASASLTGAISALLSFSDLEKGWGWVQIVSIILNGIFIGAVFVFNIT